MWRRKGLRLRLLDMRLRLCRKALQIGCVDMIYNNHLDISPDIVTMSPGALPRKRLQSTII
jgi:hypothetical protein